MTRSDLIVALASRFPNLMAKDAEIAVKVILDASEMQLHEVIASRSVALEVSV